MSNLEEDPHPIKIHKKGDLSKNNYNTNQEQETKESKFARMEGLDKVSDQMMMVPLGASVEAVSTLLG